MTLFFVNVLLAALWVLLWGSLDIGTILVGFALGYLTLYLFTRFSESGSVRDAYGRRVTDLVLFLAWFFLQLLRSNLQLAHEILTPGHGMTPRFVRYRVGHLSQAQIAVLSNAITLTPGTLVVDVSGDKRYIYVHSMYARDHAAAIRQLDRLRNRMERQLFKLDGPDPASADAQEARKPAKPPRPPETGDGHADGRKDGQHAV